MTGGQRFSRPELLVISASAICMLIVQMDWFALNLALPVIAKDFDVPPTDLQWVVSGYMLSLGALLVAGGRLADIFGRKLVLLIGLVLFGVLSAVCGSAQNEYWLISARVVQGLGAALIFPVAIAVVTSTFPEDRRGRAISIVLAFSAVGTALGPFVGGAFAEHVSWRAVFFINIPFCMAAFVLVLRYVRETRDESAPRRIDVAGLATVSGGLVAISYAIDKGQDWGWTSARTLGLIAIGILLLVAFVLVEKHVRVPFVDLELFRNRPYVAITAAGSISNIAYAVVAVLAALYLQSARGLSPLDSGLIFLALSAGAGTAAYFAGHLAERWPAEHLMACGMTIASIGVVALASVSSLWAFTPLFAVCGVGLGLGWALTNVATQGVVRPEIAGAAEGVTLTSVVMFGAIGVAVAATILEVVSGSASTAAGDSDAIKSVLIGIAALNLAGAVALVTLGRPRARPQEAAPQPEPAG
jgi:EmrB/QacA subfamily drug resistance transporter